MKTDKIFYTLFQVFPELLFQLMGEPPSLAEKYQFSSIEIKELAFRLDGVFLPDENYPDDPIYFLEVQFQEDEDFYWRFITEIFLYLNQYKPERPCHAVVLWGSYNLDGGLPLPYQQLLVNQRIQRIYLDQIAPTTPRTLGVSIIEFITASASEATQRIPLLIEQAKQDINDSVAQKKVLELIEKIVVYKFPLIPHKEIEAMFNLIDWKETQFYKDVLKEGEIKGEIKGKIEGKLETIPLLLRLGLTPEQIAQELNLDLESINQYIASQDN